VSVFLSGRTGATLASYRSALRSFSRFLGASALDDAARQLLGLPRGSANAVVLGYRAAMIDEGLAPATINHRLAAVRSLVNLARTMDLVSWALDVPGVKSKAYRDTRGPEADTVRALLSAEVASKPRDLRDRAMLRLMTDLGLRRVELVRLDAADVDLDGGRLMILGKGKLEREPVTLPAPTLAALAAWLTARGDVDGALFSSFDRRGPGGRLNVSSVARILARLCQAAGLAPINPHGLRHAAITRALNATDGDVRSVQQFSRHADLRTLMVYDDNRRDVAGDVAANVAAW